jgi:pyruvoyl-dependent arginine decarboxylase (PvlArgDC)
MHPALKLLTGLAATVVLARGASLHQGQMMMAELGQSAATAMQAHGVVDGSISFRQSSGLVARVAHLCGTADPATRAAVIADLKQHPGIADAVWSPQ